MAKKKKYYVVWKGAKPGIYSDWASAQAQIKGFTGALFKSFESSVTAAQAFSDGPKNYIGGGTPGKKSSKRKGTTPRSAIIWKSLSVDAACSGNPGRMEYQGVDTRSKDQVFHQSFPLGTNNIGEFLAIIHGLALLQKQNLPQLPIYTDSATALAWVRKKKVKTNLERTARTEKVHDMIARGEAWLKGNTITNPLIKWDTDSWGEIPADFGRK